MLFFQNLYDNAGKRIGSYASHFKTTLINWNKAVTPGESFRNRPRPISSEVFAEQIQPLMDQVSIMATSVEAKLRHGNYFVRGKPDAFCDSTGLFHCQCSLPKICPRNHKINAYESNVQRMMMELWELDHIITQAALARWVFEKATGVHNSNGKMTFNAAYFYEKICTRNNLRIVFKICHSKKSRYDMIFRNQAITTSL